MTNTGRSILVTGASKGIGQAIATRLAHDGFDVVIHYGRDWDGAQQTLQQVQNVGREGSLIQFDIADRMECKEKIESFISENGAFYGAILNAGIAKDTAFPAMTAADWDQVIHTNLDGFYNVLHPLVMPMVSARKGGRIVVMSSLSGEVGNRGQTNYSASKAGLIGAAKSLAVELGKRKITVNTIAPGLIETQMIDDLPLDQIKKTIPLQRLGTPDEVAGAVSYLCSDEAAYVTRQVLSINGGMY
ncbi:3-oxoacyl-ACP reductase FabG [Curvivirga aplysinae]|uniref:3-oxoacyl-ACP reductase FabG n=1 Tax=Curvivirga aplysinae TaxID=2529852 RepID=UPI0012BBFA3D|nr:3-oxoacyl-ACP reductase FabG [Curvivirga aplysinae]MTI11021.1 3-oxoacyl-ACP reductase FabG [Curvivirga aplysinae]